MTDLASLARQAVDESVSVDRLSPAVVEALADGEVPHCLLLGESLDVKQGGSTERVYPSVDGVVSAVVTDRRVVVVVPKVVDSRTESAALGSVSAVTVGDGQFEDLEVELPDQTLLVNARRDEEPDGFVDVLERQRNEERQREAARDAVRENGDDVEAAGRSARDGKSEPEPEPEPASASSGGTADPLERIERLAELNEKGVITDAEFEEKKADLLDQI